MNGSATRIAIAVVEHTDHFLIGHRPPGVPLAGLWEFPGGKVRSGETVEQAAVRECLEETGLPVSVEGAYPDQVHRYDYGRVHLHFLICRPVDPRKVPRPPFRWVPRGELHCYAFPAGNDALLKLLASKADASPSEGNADKRG